MWISKFLSDESGFLNYLRRKLPIPNPGFSGFSGLSGYSGIGAPTVDNGLNINAPGNIRWGGALVANTIISGITNTEGVSFKVAAGKTAKFPTIGFLDSTGAEWSRISINGDIGGNNGDIYFGYLSGSNLTSSALKNNTVMGWAAGKALTSGGGNALYGAVSGFRITTGHEISLYGCSSGVNITTGQGLSFFGDAVCVNVTTATFSDAFGAQASVPGAGTLNLSMGWASSFGIAGASTAFNNTIVGPASLASAGSTAYRNNNTVCGSSVNWTGAASYGNIVDNNTLIGANIRASAGGTLINVTVIGQGITCDINNVAILGRADQNVILGTTTSPSDNGAKLQVHGDITTTDPGSGVGKWLLGKLVTATVAADTTRYVEVKIDGVVYKLIIAA